MERIKKYIAWMDNTHIFKIILFIAAAIGFYSFVTTPYTGDIQVFMAGVNQTKYQESTGIMALFEAWDMKGIINRLILYMVYRITLIFVNYGDVYHFMVVSKAIYGLLAVLVILASALVLPVEKADKYRFGYISYFAIFTTFTASQLQAEMSVVILAILAYSLLMNDSYLKIVLGGAIGALFMFTKSVLTLVFLSVLCGVVLTKKDIKVKESVVAVSSFIISEIILFGFVFLVYPKDIMEMKNAAEYQTTLLSTGSNVPLLTIIGNLINGFIQSSVAIPFILLGVITSIYVLGIYIREKDYFKVAALILSWVFPLDMIVISNCYFIYHFFTLAFPSIISIYLYLKLKGKVDYQIYYISGIIAVLLFAVCYKLKDGLTQVSFINYSTVLIVILHLFIFSCLVYREKMNVIAVCFLELISLSTAIFFFANYSSFASPKTRNMIQMTKASAKIMDQSFPEDFGAEPVLLLDSGTVTFYNDAKSYSEYFYNLPLERWSEGKNWEVKDSEYEKFLNYSGKYVVYMSWFGLEKYPELQGKFENEYVRLEGSGYWVYSANWNVFQLDEAPAYENVINSDSSYILVRKDGI